MLQSVHTQDSLWKLVVACDLEVSRCWLYTCTFRQVLTSRDWEFVADCIGNGIIFAGGEGPTAFQDNLDPERWYLFIDEEGGRGYVPLTTKDLEAATWVLPGTVEVI